MTVSAAPPASATKPAAGRRRSRSVAGDRLATRRTLIALLASALSVIPLQSLFSDAGWLIDVWLAMAVVIVPAALLRLRRPASALDIWPGIALLVPWLTARYVSAHAWAGFLPTTATWHDLSGLMDQLHHTTSDEVAPVHTTVAVRLVICALLGLLAALIDLIAVVGHRAALAGVPMLVVYTISGAVPREPVSWLWFTFAAAGFLLLLGLDSGDDLEAWGRRIRGNTQRRRRHALTVATQRIAISAVALAILVPLLVPGQPRNLIANAFHNPGSGVGGFGGGSGGSISPFAALKGQLSHGTPISLMKVHMDASGKHTPFYLRVNVLSKYTSDGWQVDDHGSTEPVDGTGFPTDPQSGGSRGDVMQAQITITGLSGNAPVFALPDGPTSLRGLDSGTTWSPQDQLLLGSSVTPGERITETFVQPEPTIAALDNSPPVSSPTLAGFMSVPSDFPTYARNLVASLIAHASGPYQRARAIQRFFTVPSHNFVYDLHSSVGDSGSELVDFLKGRRGFCQQYAAAMAVMLRAAGVPARVVLGYMHAAPDANGNFEVTSADAHAWVEAYFVGIGWVPFDPTPPSGLAGGAESDLPWAPHQYGVSQGSADINGPHATGSGTATSGAKSGATSTGKHHPVAHHGTSGRSGPDVQMLIVLGAVLAIVLLALIPAMIRVSRRRRRLVAGRRDGDADALWAELSDTAIDLGYVWSPARSPRQVAAWLGRDVKGSQRALHALAIAVEHRRYSQGLGEPEQDGELSEQLREVTADLRRRRNARVRARAWLLPASLSRGSRGSNIARRR